MRSLILYYPLLLATVSLPAAGCTRSQTAADANVSARIARMQLRLQCQQQSALVQCQALASDDLSRPPVDERDVTDVVQWTASAPHVVRVQHGHIGVDGGGVTTVTATWAEAAGTPSASVFVVADAAHGQAQQAYVVEGEVRRFPSSQGLGGARVSLTDDRGVAQTMTTPSDVTALGQFRFRPVPPGTYRLRAVCDGYRSTEQVLVVPDDAPHTLTMLADVDGRSAVESVDPTKPRK
ncbi:MAG TPA: carboxypeptidase-like regulatory domain-containing protein [Vicinamibacterales bacterium]|nr:carboxypeptidase-like regulatory domain-containing protein [Vicinamibacterales bacterium]